MAKNRFFQIVSKWFYIDGYDRFCHPEHKIKSFCSKIRQKITKISMSKFRILPTLISKASPIWPKSWKKCFFKSSQNDLTSIVLLIFMILSTDFHVFVKKSNTILKKSVYQNSWFCLQEFERPYHYDQNFERIDFLKSPQNDLKLIVLVILEIEMTYFQVFITQGV